MTQTAKVVLTKNLTATLPTGSNAYASTLITLTDSSGAEFTAEVDGQELPVWTASFPGIANTTGGTGSVVAQDQDANGVAIGAAVTQSYTDLGTVAAATFAQTTGVSVSLTTP